MKTVIIIIIAILTGYFGYKYLNSTEPEITDVSRPDFSFGKLEGIWEWNVASQEVTINIDKQIKVKKSLLSLDLSLSEIFGQAVAKDKGSYVFIWKGGWDMSKSKVEINGNEVVILMPDFQINSIEPFYLKEEHNYSSEEEKEQWYVNRKYITADQQASMRDEITEQARIKIKETQLLQAESENIEKVVNYLKQINPQYQIIIK